MLCAECIMALDWIYPKEFPGNIFTEDMIEMWKCQNCKKLFITVTTGGKRQDAGILMVRDEKRL